MKAGVTLLLMLTTLWCATTSRASDATVLNLWPLLDYRASETADYQSLHLLGPLVKYERKGEETEYALRPFFYRSTDSRDLSSTDVFYPLFKYKSERGASNFHLFHILNYDFGTRESGSLNRSYLMPFLFYGEEEQGRYMAFFPFAGTLYNWFGQERISFTLFPLYSRIESAGRRTDHYLWPFFSRLSGEGESGFKVWPLYGQSGKRGVYQKRFFLWPIFFSELSGLDSENPVTMRAALPFYFSRESTESSFRAVLWPFFSYLEDRGKGYQSWNLPWPLVRVTQGERYHGLRILPFYADETMDVIRQRWYLWPFYKIEEFNTELVQRRRDRLLFFLYSDMEERSLQRDELKRRIDLWPLFGYSENGGVSHLHVLSLLEPFYTDNASIERLWSPLWRIYQQKWDQQGNQVVSLLWNLFWLESQSETGRLAWEVFPLIEYRNESAEQTDFSLFKGLVSYHSNDSERQLSFFYLPWSLRWNVNADEEQ